MSEEKEVGNLVVKVGLDGTGFQNGVASLNREMKVIQSEFQAATAKLGDFGNGTEGLKLKAESLTKQMDLQQQKVAALQGAYDKSAESKGTDAKATQDLQIKLNKAQAELSNIENTLKTTNAEITKQSSAWTKFSETMDSTGKKLKAVGQQMSDVGKSMSMTVTAPIVGVGVAAGKASIDFESAFAGVKKTIDASDAEFAKLRQGIRDMSKEMPAAATEIAKVEEAAGQLGIKNENIEGFTKVMINMGVATNLTSDQAATALARMANITQMPQSQFSNLGSSIVALGNNMATTESEIVAMGLRLVGAGHQVGLTEAQTLGFAAALSSVGIEAEAGGSAVSKVMIDIASEVATGGKKLEGFSKVAGMSSAQFQKSFKEDAAGTIATFIEGLGKMSESGQNVFGVLDDLGLSEIRVRDALLRASGAGDLFRSSIELSSKAWEENTALTKEAEQRYATTASKLQMMRNRLTDVGITLGDALIPAFMNFLAAMQPVFDLIADAAKWFSGLDSGIQTAIIAIAGIAAAIGPVLVVIGSLISSIGTIVTLFGSISGAVAAAGGALAIITGPIGITIAAIVALGVGIYMIIEYWDDIKIYLNSYWEWMKGFFHSWGGELVMIFLPMIGIPLMFATHWEELTTILPTIWDTIISFFSSWGPEMLATSLPMIGIPVLIYSRWEEITALLSALWNTIKTTMKSAWTTVSDSIVSIVIPIVNTVLELFDKMSGTLSNIMEGIRLYFNGIWVVIKNIFLGSVLLILDLVTGNFTKLQSDSEAIWNNLKTAFGSIWEGIKLIFSTTLEVITNLLTTVWNTITSTAKTVWNAFKAFFATLWEDIKTAASNAWTSLKQNTILLVTEIKNEVERIWNEVLTFFRNLPGILYDLAVSMFTSMKQGVISTVTSVKTAIIDGIQQAINWITDLPSKAVQWGANIVQGLIDGISSMISRVSRVASDLADGISSKIRNALSIKSPSRVMMEIGQYTGEGLALGMEGTLGDISKQASRLATAALPNMSSKSSKMGWQGDMQILVTGNHLYNEADEDRLAEKISRKFASQYGLRVGGSF